MYMYVTKDHSLKIMMIKKNPVFSNHAKVKYPLNIISYLHYGGIRLWHPGHVRPEFTTELII